MGEGMDLTFHRQRRQSVFLNTRIIFSPPFSYAKVAPHAIHLEGKSIVLALCLEPPFGMGLHEFVFVLSGQIGHTNMVL